MGCAGLFLSPGPICLGGLATLTREEVTAPGRTLQREPSAHLEPTYHSPCVCQPCLLWPRPSSGPTLPPRL